MSRSETDSRIDPKSEIDPKLYIVPMPNEYGDINTRQRIGCANNINRQLHHFDLGITHLDPFLTSRVLNNFFPPNRGFDFYFE